MDWMVVPECVDHLAIGDLLAGKVLMDHQDNL